MEEIERKFLVRNTDFMKAAKSKVLIVQGFLNTEPERTIRIRKKGNKAQLTVKGLSSEDGLSRFEWEHDIMASEAEQLFELCEPYLIRKTRYEIEVGEVVYEVDVFHDRNKGLIIAEVELESKEQEFDRPDWIGEEVTGQIRYYNSFISKNPYDSWGK